MGWVHAGCLQTWQLAQMVSTHLPHVFRTSSALCGDAAALRRVAPPSGARHPLYTTRPRRAQVSAGGGDPGRCEMCHAPYTCGVPVPPLGIRLRRRCQLAVSRGAAVADWVFYVRFHVVALWLASTAISSLALVQLVEGAPQAGGGWPQRWAVLDDLVLQQILGSAILGLACLAMAR